ncbi:Ribonuclease Z, mitochondrial, partial [Dufourea novaeangliae]
VVGSGAFGSPSSIFLSTDHTNYLFNCGETTLRLLQEHRLKVVKLEHIFITTFNWSNIGGLVGILLTLQEAGVDEIKIHTFGEIIEFLNSAKLFVYLPKLKVSYAPINELEPYNDDLVTIEYVSIAKHSNNPETCFLNETEKDQCYLNVNGKRVIDTTKTEENSMKIEKKLKTDKNILCYICEVKPKRGRLSVEKCLEYGVKVGPLYSILKKGLDVVTEGGKVVTSKDVCMPDGPKFSFIVVECPEEEYLESLVNHPKFLKYQNATPTEGDKLVCVFHITPDNIFNNSRYQDWIQKISPDTQHVILNSENFCMGNAAVYKQQFLFNMIHPEIFPLLSEDSLREDKETNSNNIQRGRTLQTLKIHPYHEELWTPKIYSEAQRYIDEVCQIDGFLDVMSNLKGQIIEKTAKLGLNNAYEYPRIVMLGTGSSVPNKVRNTSAIFLRITENNSILLDCGEGTVAQFVRFYGNSKVKNILRSLKAIYISHMHADHHMGLISLLQAREKVTNDKIYIIAPTQIQQWLSHYEQIEPISHLYTVINNVDFHVNGHRLAKYFEKMFYSSLNIKEMNTVFVKHCKNSFGIAITLKDNRKIVYSGDAMPSDTLINVGKNCDLLIHEATMEDKLKDMATMKYHSTTSQAINVGKSMNAKFILLTHFSQRYSKIPVFTTEQDNVGLAYDNMDIRLSHLPLLPLFYPCLKVMLSEHYEVVEKRTQKKDAVIA